MRWAACNVIDERGKKSQIRVLKESVGAGVGGEARPEPLISQKKFPE